MKWINLAEREPPTDGESKIIIRRISDKSVSFGLIFHLTHETPRRWTLWNPKENKRLTSENFSDYEWLDETGVDDKITFKAIDQFGREIRTQVYISQEGNIYKDADPRGVDMSGKRTIYRDSQIKIIQT